MNRVHKSIVSIVGMLLLSLMVMTSHARAEVMERDLFYNDDKQSIQINISFEHSDVDLRLVTPSGRIITPEEDSADVTVFSSSSGMYFIIKDAEKGQWKISYDKGSNEKISASVDKYQEPIWITSFDIVSIEDELLTYDFLVEHTEETHYNYIISLSTDNEGGAKKTLTTGYAYANSNVSGTINISNVNTHDEYYLQLYVNYYENGLEYFDLVYSESFSYVNKTYVSPVSDFDITVYPSTSYINVNWKSYVPYEADQIYVIAKGDGNVIYSSLYNPWEYDQSTISYEEGTKSVEIGISVQNSYGIISETLYKTILIEKEDKDFKLNISEEGLINSYQWIFGYENAVNQQIDFTINDVVQSLVLDGSGEKYLELPSEVNNIVLSYIDTEGIRYEYPLIVSVDSIPPYLKILENIDGSSTLNDSVIITGRTDVGSILAINDTEVTVDEDGLFIYTLPLVVGTNEIIITSADQVGNVTSYTASIQRKDNGLAVMNRSEVSSQGGSTPFIKRFFPWNIIALSLIVIIIVLVIILSVKKKRRKSVDKQEKKSKLKLLYGLSLGFGILTAVLGIGGMVYYIIRRNYEKSEEYIRLAYETVGEAYDYLVLTQKIKDISLVILIIAAVLIVLAVIFKVILLTAINKGISLAEDNDLLEYTEVEEVTSHESQDNIEPVENVDSQEALDNKDNVDKTDNIESADKVDNVDNTGGSEMIKYCVTCGAKMKLHDKFCGYCGTKPIE